jgi:hypothetical protein
MTLPANVREALLRAGAFEIRVMPSASWLNIRPGQHQAIPWHETVLRPLLAAADEAWVYELNEDSKVFEIAGGILRREKGKYRIGLSGDPIRGYELLWNASGGQRGSIALVIPSSRFPALDIYPHCLRAYVVGNPAVSHSASAIRLAKAKAADGQFVCCLLSRTNGFEWLSIHASVPELERMLIQAQSLVVEHALYGHGAA